MSKLNCYWCNKRITREEAYILLEEYVCNECYNDIISYIESDIEIECAKCSASKYISEELYCSSCYEHAKEAKCASCGDFVNTDEIEIFCKDCMEEAIKSTQEVSKYGGSKKESKQ
jgi:RecJ-like exonuclease